MARYNSYNVGTAVTIYCTFSVSGVNTDPTTITLEITDPQANTDTYTYALAQITKTATGMYNKEITPDEAGLWRYRWIGTGTCIATNQYKFKVVST
jgi:hypothetical protein